MTGPDDELARLRADHARLLAAFGEPDPDGWCTAVIHVKTRDRWMTAAAAVPVDCRVTAVMSDARTETIDRRP